MKTREFIFYRPDISKYQAANFKELERSFIEKIPHLKYISKKSDLFSNDNIEKEIIFCSTSNLICKNHEELYPRIKLWIHPNSGYDNLEIELIKNSTFPIIIGNSIRADAVFLYIVNCITKYLGEIPFRPDWDMSRSFERRDIYQEKFLIIGHGHIGEKVSTFLEASNINYKVYDPHKSVDFKNKTSAFDLSDFDCVILTCSLNESSRYILGGKNLGSLKKNICIINAARGELIQESALIAYKKNHPNALIFLDVFEEEPCDFSRFSSLANIYKSSHVAGVYNQIDKKIIEFECQVISSFLNLSFSEFEVKYTKSNLRNRLSKNGSLI